ncbi:NAD-dependent epimerase/dehydratase family protein [Candidatus Woesearchaeota archaeon]|nr:NAD-dependent epimerase/dehydratase family protein [Candidatus Woesearchaeota archaeon]
MQQILVTGGNGFLGQHLVKLLLEKYPALKVKIVDLKEQERPLYSFKQDPRVTYSVGKNICDYDSISNEFKSIDVVIHLAGLVSFWRKDKDKLFSINVEGTKNVFRAAVENKVGRFIHISSVAALGYSNDRSNPIDENFVFDWDIAKKYKKYYMLSKHLADEHIIKESKGKIKLNIAYPGLMLGPGDGNNSVKLLNALKNRKLFLNPPGGTNVIDVRDVAAGLIAVLEKGQDDEHYLLSGHNLTFIEQNKTISAVLNVKSPAATLPSMAFYLLYPLVIGAESLTSTPLQLTSDNLHSSFKFRYFDHSKAKRELGWAPQISFNKTIEDTYKWMQENDLTER